MVWPSSALGPKVSKYRDAVNNAAVRRGPLLRKVLKGARDPRIYSRYLRIKFEARRGLYLLEACQLRFLKESGVSAT